MNNSLLQVTDLIEAHVTAMSFRLTLLISSKMLRTRTVIIHIIMGGEISIYSLE